jgi:hypothetical protein
MKQEANGCGKAYKTKKQDANYPVQRQKVHMVNDHIVASATWESTERRHCCAGMSTVTADNIVLIGPYS